MIQLDEVKRLASARLKDAQALFSKKRYDGAVYMCGYAVELALKARICRTLNWAGFPETGSEFKGLNCLKVHDLEMLLRLTGRETSIKGNLLLEWSAVIEWSPEVRYKPVGTFTATDADLMLKSAARLVRKL